MRIYRSGDSDPVLLRDKKIVVMGYGNQGRPQALNLRDSGVDVSVAAREGKEGWKSAVADRFEALSLEEGVSKADILMLLIPDEKQGEAFSGVIEGNLREGKPICFAHGFAVAFGEIDTEKHPLLLVAPKGQGKRVRESYLEGSGLPCLVGVENDIHGNGLGIALAIAGALGCLRVGAFETSFREEAVSDIFGEQAVLCGGVTAIVKAAFDTLVSRGFSPEVAYFECMHELKIIVDLFSREGISGMREVISGTAAYGGLRYGEDLVGREAAEGMGRLFEFIDSGEFARDWLKEADSGGGTLKKLIEEEKGLLIEEVGEKVRKLFPENG